MSKSLTQYAQNQITNVDVKIQFVLSIGGHDYSDYLVSWSIETSKDFGSMSATFSLNNNNGIFGESGANKINIGDVVSFSEYFGGDTSEYKRFYGIVQQRSINKSGTDRTITLVCMDYIATLQFLDIDLKVEGTKTEITEEVLTPNYLTSPNDNLAQLFDFANNALADNPLPMITIRNKSTLVEDPMYDGLEIYYDVGQLKLGFPLNARYNYDVVATSYSFYTHGLFIEDIIEDILILPDGYGGYLFGETSAQAVIDNHLTETFLNMEGTTTDYLTPNYTSSTITIETTLTSDVGAGSTSINVTDTTGFPTSGQGSVNGDIFTWTGKTTTTLTGIPATGSYALTNHKSGSYVEYENTYSAGQVWYLKYSNLITDLSVSGNCANTDEVPKMTSNTDPSGEASAISRYDANKDAWKAFNNTQVSGSDDGWMGQLDPTITPQWLQYQFTSPKVINRYIVTNRNHSVPRSPTDWTLLGSNDGVNFTLLDTQVDQFLSDIPNTSYTYNITNHTAYTYYRILVTDGTRVNSPWTIAIGELELIDNTFTVPDTTIAYLDKRYGRIILTSAISTSAIVKCNVDYSFSTLQATGVEINKISFRSREVENRFEALKKLFSYLAPNYSIRTLGDNKIWSTYLSQKLTEDYTLELMTQATYMEDEDLYTRCIFYAKNKQPTNLMFNDGVDFLTTGESYTGIATNSELTRLREEDNYYVYGLDVDGVGKITANTIQPIVYVNNVPIDNQSHQMVAQSVILEVTTRTETTQSSGGK